MCVTEVNYSHLVLTLECELGGVIIGGDELPASDSTSLLSVGDAATVSGRMVMPRSSRSSSSYKNSFSSKSASWLESM